MDQVRLSYFKLAVDMIKGVKDFDGEDSAQLPDFFQQVQNILPTFEHFDVVHKQILFTFIKNKCTGKCRSALHKESSIDNWDNLKTALVKHFAEKKNIHELMDELKTLTLRGTIENFYNRINKIVARLNNKRLTSDENTYTAEEINRISLRTFRDNMPEPTKTMLFARNPDNLENAYQLILDAKHQHLTQFGFNNNNHRSDRNTNRLNDNDNTNPNNNRKYNNNYNRNNNNNNYNHNNNNNNRNYSHSNNNHGNNNTYRSYDNNVNRSYDNNNDRQSNTLRYNSNNQHSQNTRQNSRNMRQNFNNNRAPSGNNRSSAIDNNSGNEPMDISQFNSDFHPDPPNNYLI